MKKGRPRKGLKSELADSIFDHFREEGGPEWAHVLAWALWAYMPVKDLYRLHCDLKEVELKHIEAAVAQLAEFQASTLATGVQLPVAAPVAGFAKC